MSGVLNMLLAGGPKVTLSGAAISEVTGGLSTAVAGVKVDADGNVYQKTSGGYAQISSTTDWLRPASGMSSYEVRATLNSGALAAGTTGSWLPLSADQEWECQATIGIQQQANLTIEIRRGSTVLASNTYTLDADAR